MSSSAATAARERPILFSGPMMRALLDGTKTQTRRVVKPQPFEDGYFDGAISGATMVVGSTHREVCTALFSADAVGGGAIRTEAIDCPYGAPGDRLWVREAWSAQFEWPDDDRGPFCWWEDTPPANRLAANALRTFYRADASEYDVYDLGPELGIDVARHEPDEDLEPVVVPRWGPSIHMPRWASRLTLEITDVRVERLQEITEDDARAEGASHGQPPYASSEREWFALLWQSINGKRGLGWAANPWVWVLSFRRVSA